jgi:leukotriene-A4 hydrolase
MLGHYIDKYRNMSVTYLEFRLTFNQWLKDNYVPADAEAAIAKVNWDLWVLGPGLSPVSLDFSTPNATEFTNMALDYIARKGDSSAANYTDYLHTKDPNLKVIFLDTLALNSDLLTPKLLAKIDADLNVTYDRNPEVGQRWFPMAVQQGYQPAMERAKNYTQSIGRQKYIIPVYTALVRNGLRQTAFEWYNERKDFYHPLTARKIRNIIFSTVVGEPAIQEAPAQATPTLFLQ